MGINTTWLDIFFRIAPACFYDLADLLQKDRSQDGLTQAQAAANYTRETLVMAARVFEHSRRSQWKPRAQLQRELGELFRSFGTPVEETARVADWREQRVRGWCGAAHSVILDAPVYMFKLLSGERLTWGDVRRGIRHVFEQSPGVRAGVTRWMVVLFDDHDAVPTVKSIEQEQRRRARDEPFTRDELRAGGVMIGGADDSVPVPPLGRMMATACLRPLLIALFTQEFLAAAGQSASSDTELVIDGGIVCVDMRNTSEVNAALQRAADDDDPRRWAAALPPAAQHEPQLVLRQRCGERSYRVDGPRRREAPRGEADQKFMLWLARTTTLDPHAAPGSAAMLCSTDSDWLLVWLLNMHRVRRAHEEVCNFRVYLDSGGRTRASGRQRVIDLSWLARELRFFVLARIPGASEPLVILAALMLLTGSDYVKNTIPRLGPVRLFQIVFGISSNVADSAILSYLMSNERADMVSSLVNSPASSTSTSSYDSICARMLRAHVSGNSRYPPPMPYGVPIFRMRDMHRFSPPEASEQDAPPDYLLVAEHRFVCFLLNIIGRLHAGVSSEQNAKIGEHINLIESWFNGDDARRLTRRHRPDDCEELEEMIDDDGKVSSAYVSSVRRQEGTMDTAAFGNNMRDRFQHVLLRDKVETADGYLFDVTQRNAAYPPVEERSPDQYREQIEQGISRSSSSSLLVPTTMELLTLARRVVWELMYRLNTNSRPVLDPLEMRDGQSVWGWRLDVRNIGDSALEARVVLCNSVWFEKSAWT